MNAEEGELVEAAGNGQADAFSELVRRYQPVCLKIARSVLRHLEQAEDEAQSALTTGFAALAWN
jgi:DNA-directed RNA polymerase specialized sigma24 family protein